ncbi:MAG: tripartite tricarboxylate transporter substrate binding protein [Variovorax sp.]|nr:MAG: tripartite tricarboxylate transporter substrate binding protein [Variovorax sp.]
MTMQRRTFAAAMAAAGLQGLAGLAHAQAFPARPVTLVVPYAAGGNGDLTARLFAESFSKVLAQSVVVENRAGGGGAIGATYVAGSRPDGYTLFVAAKGVFAITPNLVKVSYSMDNFKPVGFISRTPMVLVVKKGSKFKSLENVIEAARKEPGRLAVGMGAMGSDNHVALMQLELAAKCSFNSVAYKGAAPMLQDILASQLDVGVDQLTTSKPFLESGDLIALAVLGTSQEPSLPSVPTIARIGAEPFDSTTYIGLLAPRATPEATVAILGSGLRKALEDPRLNAGFSKSGGSIYAGEPGEFESRVQRESDFIRKMIQDGKIQRE